jgi:hypothetical protein
LKYQYLSFVTSSLNFLDQHTHNRIRVKKNYTWQCYFILFLYYRFVWRMQFKCTYSQIWRAHTPIGRVFSLYLISINSAFASIEPTHATRHSLKILWSMSISKILMSARFMLNIIAARIVYADNVIERFYIPTSVVTKLYRVTLGHTRLKFKQ